MDPLFDPGEPLDDEPRRAQLEHVRDVERELAPLGRVVRVAKLGGEPLPEELREHMGGKAATRWPELWLQREGGDDYLIRCCARTEKNKVRAGIDQWLMDPESWAFQERLDRALRSYMAAAVVIAFDERPLTGVLFAAVGPRHTAEATGRPLGHSGPGRVQFAPKNRVPLVDLLGGEDLAA